MFEALSGFTTNKRFKNRVRTQRRLNNRFKTVLKINFTRAQRADETR